MFDTTVNTDLSEIRALLERLVQAIERLSPPPIPDAHSLPVYQSTLTDLHTIDDEASERAKQTEEYLAERFGVVWQSPAWERAKAEYENEMRRVHGKDATVNWNEVFTEAARDLGDADLKD